MNVATLESPLTVTDPLMPIPSLARVILVVFSVVGSMDSLKAIVTAVFVATLISPEAGTIATIVGAVRSTSIAVVKAQTLLVDMGFPERSWTPVVIVATITLPRGSETAGVNVALIPSPLTKMAPVMGDVPLAKVKVVTLMVEAFIASVKLAVTRVPVETSVARLSGTTETTAGGVASAVSLVVNVQAKVADMGFPAESSTPDLTEAV